MTGFNGSFDASQFAPRQGGEAHPVGMYPFTITDTKLVETKDKTGGMFVVEFTSPSGSISNRYNIFNQSAKAVEIAHGQLSALCHATGVFKLDWSNEGAALRGARGQMKVDYQKGEEPSSEKPHGGYVEIKKIYDINGNEPGKAPAAAPQPQQQSAPANGAAPSVNNGGWAQATAPQPGLQPAPWPGPNGASAPQVQQGPISWQPGPTQAPATDSKPPWAK